MVRDALEGIAMRNENGDKAGRISRDIETRMIKNSLDVIILKEVKNKPLSGYDVISLVHRKFGILLSAGTVYSLMYALERDGLIKAQFNQRKRNYKLTQTGEERLRNILDAQDRIKALANTIF